MSRFVAVFHHWHITKRNLGFEVHSLAGRDQAQAHREACARLADQEVSDIVRCAFTLVEIGAHEHVARPLSWRERITGRFEGRG
ncbi:MULTISPECIES: hypothetical protein [Pseudomonas]|jgi:hypothetical protein|uniref:Uncharacterized protein n=2 Tax=Pseudomonas TaxID=286 RepID=A0ABX8DK92_9PSED|nr:MULTISPECIES: hypothetical protein [Pseudomonas]KIU48170.1 hypothetical protein QV12_18430 [Pseudomonas putida]KTC22291.1 hypothetical protein AO392_17715 [Pseudomonas putida]MCO7505721.1 hypothetical protein [Pseudomonas sp. VE 267-6A]MCO7530557.1 hypothetical protein [Pseudomonas sp. 2]MCP8351171.1 hypothetical protein [Pseudomonas sp. FBF18]